MSAKLIAIIVLLILLLIFAIQNIQSVVLNFLFWQISTSSVLSILVSFVIGLMTGCLLMMIGRMKKKSPPSWLFFFQLVVMPSCPIFCKSLDEPGKVIKRSIIFFPSKYIIGVGSRHRLGLVCLRETWDSGKRRGHDGVLNGQRSISNKGERRWRQWRDGWGCWCVCFLQRWWWFHHPRPKTRRPWW